MEKYSHLRVVGEGSFGRAVLVQHKHTQEKCILKEIQLPKVGANRDFIFEVCRACAVQQEWKKYNAE